MPDLAAPPPETRRAPPGLLAVPTLVRVLLALGFLLGIGLTGGVQWVALGDLEVLAREERTLSEAQRTEAQANRLAADLHAMAVHVDGKPAPPGDPRRALFEEARESARGNAGRLSGVLAERTAGYSAFLSELLTGPRATEARRAEGRQLRQELFAAIGALRSDAALAAERAESAVRMQRERIVWWGWLRAIGVGALLVLLWAGGEVVRWRQQAHAEFLKALAWRDALTGLRNRRAFDDDLAREWSRAVRADQPLSLLLLDIDDFKRFNTDFGHPGGDATLQATARAVEDAVLRATDLVARYGGEELAVLLPDTKAEAALTVAERLRERLAQVSWPHRAVTVSIGIATRDAAMADGGALTAAAAAALKRAKESGKDRAVHARDL